MRAFANAALRSTRTVGALPQRALPRCLPALGRHQLLPAQERSAMSLRCLSRSEPVPSQVVATLRHGDILFACEPLDLAEELDQAIDQVGRASIDWMRDHGAKIDEDITSQHCAMVVADANGNATNALEAVRLLGVRLLSLDGFFTEFVNGTRFFRGRVEGVSDDVRRKAVSWALLRSGARYAHDFAPPKINDAQPWTEEHYCCGLIDHAYRQATGKELFFTEKPFPLVFEPKHFWTKYYEEKGMAKPTGFGSNPTMLMHSPKVTITELNVKAK